MSAEEKAAYLEGVIKHASHYGMNPAVARDILDTLAAKERCPCKPA